MFLSIHYRQKHKALCHIVNQALASHFIQSKICAHASVVCSISLTIYNMNMVGGYGPIELAKHFFDVLSIHVIVVCKELQQR